MLLKPSPRSAGGRSYDRDHAIVWDMAEERPTQIWDIQVL